jgi:hypothetical protein
MRTDRREQLAWLAGLIDGEGCISLTRRNPQPHNASISYNYRLILKVSMCHLPTVLRCRELTGVGTLHSQQKQHAHYSSAYVWFCNAGDAETVLEALLPWFVTKREEALTALDFLRLPLAKRGGNGGGDTVSEELEQRRSEYWEKLRNLKSSNRSADRKKP